ncbi:uncharacterized protein [Hetaerina americana]|uniref:uncharacterized protein n=1 Tax=Hetaerina americana TaxID=62018 RepID=UPI003A7F15D6
MVTAKEHEDGSLRKCVEQLFRKMLLVWCRETMAIGKLPRRGGESDKRVVVKRERGGEFGFRIHGSRPVVVSAIEAGTPAESSGLEVGDIVLSVNGAPVLDASHSEVVKIAHAGSDTLELEVARTCDVLTPVLRTVEGVDTEWGEAEGVADMLLAGYLWKMATSGGGVGRWHRRWFCLRRNHCLYYYKTEEEVQPLGALALAGYSLEILEPKDGAGEGAGEDTGWEPAIAFRIWRRGALGLTLGAETLDTGNQWSRALGIAIERSSQGDAWLEEVERLVGMGPGAIIRPDCFGYLSYLQATETERSSSVGGPGRRRGKSTGSMASTGGWRRRYCVLKDACLFFYEDVDSRLAVGMACLHGYRVQSSSPAVGPPGAGKRLFAFEVLPPLAPSPTADHHHHHHHHHGGHHRHHTTGQRHASPYHQRHFHFHTDTEMDKKRWLAALEYSIDRWIKVG